MGKRRPQSRGRCQGNFALSKAPYSAAIKATAIEHCQVNRARSKSTLHRLKSRNGYRP
jgi:hypothetical protein